MIQFSSDHFQLEKWYDLKWYWEWYSFLWDLLVTFWLHRLSCWSNQLTITLSIFISQLFLRHQSHNDWWTRVVSQVESGIVCRFLWVFISPKISWSWFVKCSSRNSLLLLFMEQLSWPILEIWLFSFLLWSHTSLQQFLLEQLQIVKASDFSHRSNWVHANEREE